MTPRTSDHLNQSNQTIRYTYGSNMKCIGSIAILYTWYSLYMKLKSAFASKQFRAMPGMICKKTEISVQLHVHALALCTPWKSTHWTLIRFGVL